MAWNCRVGAVVHRRRLRNAASHLPGVRRWGYQGNRIVFSVILARLALFSEAQFKWRDLTSKKLFGTAELSLLENPWPGGTTGELLARMEQDVSLAGNAFIRSTGDRLVRLRPDWVDIIRTEDEAVPGLSATCTGRKAACVTTRPSSIPSTRSRTGLRSRIRWQCSAACRGSPRWCGRSTPTSR